MSNVLHGVLHLLSTLPMGWAYSEDKGLPTKIGFLCDAHRSPSGQVAFARLQIVGTYSPLTSDAIPDNELGWVVKALLLYAGCYLVPTSPEGLSVYALSKTTSSHAHLCALQSILPALQSLGWIPGTPLQSCAQTAKAFVKGSPNNHTFRW